MISCPPGAESPFARHGCYPCQSGVQRRFDRRYPIFVAHTGSCASPKSSARHCVCSSGRSLQVAASPCWKWDLPDIIPCNPCVGARTHTPWCSPSARVRFFLGDAGLRASGTCSTHQTTLVMQLQRGTQFRGCSHSLMFGPPHSLDLPAAPTAAPRRGWAARPFTPRIARLVACPGMWHRYVSDTDN